MEDFAIKNPPEFNQNLRKLETTDRNHADVFNKEFEQLINNDVFLKAVANLVVEHMENDAIHVTNQDKQTWSSKAGTAVATQTTNGLESAADKKKLDGIKSGAEVNQNAFSKITSGNVTIAANAKEATLLLQAGSNVTITADNATKKVTIAATKDGGNAATLGGHAATYFAQSNHNHDSRYYTETEVNNLLSGKAAATHTHSYLSLSGGTLTGNLKVNTTLNAVNFQENGVAGHLVYIGSTAPSNTNMVWVD